MVVIVMQYVDLSDSRLSGAIARIPKNELDFDPDWEIDPKDIVLLDKLGKPVMPDPVTQQHPCLGLSVNTINFPS